MSAMQPRSRAKRTSPRESRTLAMHEQAASICRLLLQRMHDGIVLAHIETERWRTSVPSQTLTRTGLAALAAARAASRAPLERFRFNRIGKRSRSFILSSFILSHFLLTPDAELYGGGLIVEGSRATGTFQKCTIKSMKDDGADIRLIAACSTGVMVSDLEFMVKVVGDNQIMVSMPAPDNMATPYVRCPR
jgi:hypothetical protein